jgi:hypothetical protein
MVAVAAKEVVAEVAAEAAAEATMATAVVAATEGAAATKAAATAKGAGATEGAAATAVAWRSTEHGGQLAVSCVSQNRVEKVCTYSTLGFFVYQIHFLRSFLRRPHTDRFPDDVLKKLRQNRNRDSCKKNSTGTENTGIWRIPAGIGNLGQTE